MSTASDWCIYVGQLTKCLRNRDVKTLFKCFGRVMRCDIKYEAELAYAFIDFQVRESAENCIKFANGWEINGHNIIVEWANGRKEREVDRKSDSSSQNLDVCLRCHRVGHWAQDCPEVGKLGRRGGGGGRPRSPNCRFVHKDLDQSHTSRSNSCDRRRRHHIRSHDRHRCSRSNDKKWSGSRYGDRNRSRSGSNHRKTSRAPGVGP